MLGGHVSIGDNTVVGGHVAFHQFVRVGEGVMISGNSGVTSDVVPFAYTYGHRAALAGLNVVGLRRRGATRAQMHVLRRAYRALFEDGERLADRIDTVAREFADDPWVGKIISFIRAGGKRPLMRPAAKVALDEPGDDAS